MRSGRALPTPGQSAGRLPIRVFVPTLAARIRYCFLPAGISRATQGLRAATCLATPGCLAEAASQEWTLSGNQFTWLGDRCWPRLCENSRDHFLCVYFGHVDAVS